MYSLLLSYDSSIYYNILEHHFEVLLLEKTKHICIKEQKSQENKVLSGKKIKNNSLGYYIFRFM